MTVDSASASEKLRCIGQSQLMSSFDSLPSEKQQQLLQQIESLNIPTFRLQQQMLLEHTPHEPHFLEPFDQVLTSGNEEMAELGRNLISEGKVGCLLISGGMGTRLRWDGPKGTYPASVIEKKSLFQLFAEKTAAAGRQVEQELPLAIMTSPVNHEETVSYFEKNQNFGLPHIDFFSQGMLPLLDHDGNLFLDAPGHIAMGPDGNGSSLIHFYNSSIWQKWYDQGVRIVNFVLIDNPLADPFDAELIGTHHYYGVDVMVKCTKRANDKEKVGILVELEDKVHVIEYSELPKDEPVEKYPHANLSLFSFSMDFIKKHAKEEIPLHLAHKAVPTLENPKPKEPNSWKFEKFIFDVLPQAVAVKALCYPREVCFAPLKNAEGPDSPETMKAALQERDCKVFKEITGKEPPEDAFELAQDFYYPTAELLEKWRGREVPESGYIMP